MNATARISHLPRRRTWLAVFVAMAAIVSAVAAPAGEPAETVLRADEARLAAMIAVDLPALERALTDDCLYVHSNGLTQTKADLITALKTGAMKYTEIRYVDAPRVRLYGENAAVLTGTTRVAVALPDGRAVTPTLLMTALYVRQDASWQLASYQSTTAPAR